MNKFIDELLKFFEFKTRTGESESITILKREAPEYLLDSVHKAHGDRLPDDWIYSTYWRILEALSGYTINDENDLDEFRAEIVDGLVDVYTSNLTAWLNSDNRNVYYLEESQKEYGTTEDGFKLLAQAQYMAIDEIYSEVSAMLDANLSDDNNQSENE